MIQSWSFHASNMKLPMAVPRRFADERAHLEYPVCPRESAVRPDLGEDAVFRRAEERRLDRDQEQTA